MSGNFTGMHSYCGSKYLYYGNSPTVTSSYSFLSYSGMSFYIYTDTRYTINYLYLHACQPNYATCDSNRGVLPISIEIKTVC